MSKIDCSCGATINLSCLPNPNGFLILSDEALEPFVDALTQNHRAASSDAQFEDRTFHTFRTTGPGVANAYECSNCGRLWVFAHGGAEPDVVYQPQGEPSGKLADVIRRANADRLAPRKGG